MSFSSVFSLYKNDARLSTSTKAKAGYCASYKVEFNTGKKLNFIAGIDFVVQRFSFRGYYAAPMHTYIYDKTFSYIHSLNMQEIQLPLGIRFSFFEKPINNYAPYFTGGIKLRYLLKTSTIIKDDSTKTNVYTGTKPSSITFESNIPSAKMNACFQAGFGIQRKYEEINSSMFLEATFNYGISRLYYTGYNNSNHLGIRNVFVAFAFGWRL